MSVPLLFSSPLLFWKPEIVCSEAVGLMACWWRLNNKTWLYPISGFSLLLSHSITGIQGSWEACQQQQPESLADLSKGLCAGWEVWREFLSQGSAKIQASGSVQVEQLRASPKPFLQRQWISFRGGPLFSWGCRSSWSGGRLLKVSLDGHEVGNSYMPLTPDQSGFHTESSAAAQWSHPTPTRSTFSLLCAPELGVPTFP